MAFLFLVFPTLSYITSYTHLLVRNILTRFRQDNDKGRICADKTVLVQSQGISVKNAPCRVLGMGLTVLQHYTSHSKSVFVSIWVRILSLYSTRCIIPVNEDSSGSDYMEEGIYKSFMGYYEDEILACGGISGTTPLFTRVCGLI